MATPPTSSSSTGAPAHVPKGETEESMKELEKLASVLHRGVSAAHPVVNGRTLTGFRGKKMVEFMLQCNKPGFEDLDVEGAKKLARRLMSAGFFRQAVKSKEDPRYWHVVPGRGQFGVDRSDRYLWEYQGSATRTYVMLGVLLVVAFAVVLFPVWPMAMRVGAWYVSVTLLLVMLGSLTLRYLVFGVAWLVGYDVWILPNVFADDIDVSELLTPVVSLERSAPGQGMARLAVVGVLAGVAYLIYTQPTEFDRFVFAQRKFIDNLYSGALLSDTSQQYKDTIDEVKEHVDDLLSKMDAEGGAVPDVPPLAGERGDGDEEAGEDDEVVRYDEEGELIVDEEALRDELLREIQEDDS